jgi:drug/metabolite transporter (DMT)-like permease
MTPSQGGDMWYGVLCGVAAGAMWGTIFVLPAWLAAFSPLELALGRYLAYGAIMLALLAPRLSGLLKRLTRADCMVLLRHALAGNIVYYLLLSFGVQLAGVAAASLVIGLLPLSVTLVGRRDHGSVPLRRLAWPLLVVVAGMVCINVEVFTAARAGWAASALGMLCAFGALLCWTWYAVDNARFLKRNARFSSAEWSGLYGISTGVIALAIASATGLVAIGAGGLGAPGRDWPRFWGLIALVATAASVIGNQLWNIASRRVPVTLSGQLLLFEVLFGLLYGFLYHRQTPRPLEWLAILLLIVGVAWSVWLHARPSSAAGVTVLAPGLEDHHRHGVR